MQEVHTGRSARSKAMTWVLMGAIVAVIMGREAAAGGPPALPVSGTTLNEDYVVFWNPNPFSDDFMPSSKAINAALALDRQGDSGPGNPLGYHDGYISALFTYPYFSEQPKSVYFYDCKDSGCDNGQAPVSDIRMPVSVYANQSDSCIMGILGHELFHHVEFAYAEILGSSGCGSIWGNTACEGQARALQDKIYTILDWFPAASCVATYLGQVNGYLDDTNQYLWTSSYDAALWWNYLMEQYGINAQEPGLGIDFLTLWWGRALAAGLAGADALNITDDTIKLYDPSDNVFNAFRHFAIANLVKDLDLSAVGDAFRNRYSYRDEDPVGFNLMDYNNVTIEFTPGPLLPGVDINQLMGVQYFGARYLRTDISECPANRIIRVEIDAADTAPSGVSNLAGYGVILTRNGQPKQFFKKFDVDWTLTTFQSGNPYDRLYLVVAPVAGFWVANITISCTPPETTLDLDFPIVGPSNPTHGGPPGSLATAVVEVAPVFDNLRGRPPVSGLPAGVFQATVGGLQAQTVGAVQSENGYQLLLGLPPQSGPGSYDLELQIGDVVATAPSAIVHDDAPLPEVILAVDTSTTMLEPPDGSRLEAARKGAAHFFDLLPGAGQIGLIDFSGNDVEPDDDALTAAPLEPVDAMHLDRLKTAAAALSSGAGRFTSIGDAAELARTMFLADGTPTRAKHLVLVSDGPENEGLYWSDVRDAVKAAGIRVHTIALGPLADQPLLYAIARETGGEYRYADAEPPAADVLDLYAALAQIAEAIEGHSQLFRFDLDLLANETRVVEASVGVDLDSPLVASVRNGAVFPGGQDVVHIRRLYRPDGSEVLDGIDGAVVRDNQGSLVFIAEPMRGTWRFEITSNAMAGNTPVEVALAGKPDNGLRVVAGVFLPEVDDEVLTEFQSGQQLGLSVAVADHGGPVALAGLEVEARRPGGGPHIRIFNGVPAANDPADRIFFPDPDCGPGCKGGGTGTFTFDDLDIRLAAGQGSPTGFADDGIGPGAQGSYELRLTTTLPGGQQLISHKAVAVVQQAVFPDRDNDTLPDAYEDRHDCLNGDQDDATLDGDGDGLHNRAEFDQGTHPCDPDSDRGGEADGSEVRGGRNPLHPDDDALGRPLDAYVVNERSEHEQYAAPLAPNAVTVKLPGIRKFSNITLKRGIVESALTPLVTLDLSTFSDPVHVDQNVVIGQEYFYQWVGTDDDGNESAPSYVFSGFALADPTAPMGAVLVNDGAARTDDPLLSIENSLYNKDPVRTEYRGALDDQDPGAWLPYAAQWNETAPAVTAPTIRTITMVLRDGNGLESTTYADDIEQWPAGSLGDVHGNVELLGGPADRSGVLVEILGDETEKPALTDSEGNFVLRDLVPGTYTLMFSRFEHETANTANVRVFAGEITALEPVFLLADIESVFRDGFE